MIVLAILSTMAVDPPEPEAQDLRMEASEELTPESAASDVSPETTLLDSLRSGGIGKLRSLWKDLGINTDIFADRGDGDPIEVVRFAAELDGTDGEELLLTITDSSAWDYQFLALDHAESGWRNLGFVDVRNQRSGPPQHRIESLGGGGRWLVIRALKGGGSGFSRVHDTWYAAGGSLQSVLSYPVEGHVNGHDMPFNRSFSGSPRGIGSDEGEPAVDVDLSIRYTNGELFSIEGLSELFTRTASIRYTLDEEADRFVLDEAESGMNEAEIEGIFGDDAEGFLRHNFTQLKEIAQSGDDLKRQWLRHFLEGREESSEKSVLQGLLEPREAVGEPATSPPLHP